MERAVFDHNRYLGVGTFGAATKLTLTGVVVMNTLPTDDTGEYGVGVGASAGATLDILSSRVTSSHVARILVQQGGRFTGACDVGESCNGITSNCPSDTLVPAGTLCRAAAGPCDMAESCTGASPSCPQDAKMASGTVCRPSVGDCDVSEDCDGVAGDCPPDGLVAAGSVCRAAVGSCDATESCTGTSAACPEDIALPDGTACDDEEACTVSDTCQAGVCLGSSPSPCAALDECHVAGSCDPKSGDCSNPVAAEGTPCSSGTCVAGVCSGRDSSGTGDAVQGQSAGGCGCRMSDPAPSSAYLWAVIGAVGVALRRGRRRGR